MTAISYLDREAASPNGELRLEARSPDNRKILRRDGTSPPPDHYPFKYGDHQADFRYRLLDSTGAVRWERWQQADENSPAELVIANNGWSVLRLHGFAPAVVVVTPDGRDLLRIRVVGPEDAHPETLVDNTWRFWEIAHIEYSTAGNFWSSNGWRYFLDFEDSRYFVWRTARGERLVIDLDLAVVCKAELSSELAAAMRRQESSEVAALLTDLSERIDEIQMLAPPVREELSFAPDLPHKISYLTAAIQLAGVHGLKELVPRLQKLATIDWVGHWSLDSALGFCWATESQRFRPLINHSLRLLGVEPSGRPAYGFVRDWTKYTRKYPICERGSSRRNWAAGVHRWMTAAQVLRQVGTPDYIHSNAWGQDWEYDFRDDETWVTLRLTWKTVFLFWSTLVKVEWVCPSPWINSDERSLELLEWG